MSRVGYNTCYLFRTTSLKGEQSPTLVPSMQPSATPSKRTCTTCSLRTFQRLQVSPRSNVRNVSTRHARLVANDATRVNNMNFVLYLAWCPRCCHRQHTVTAYELVQSDKFFFVTFVHVSRTAEHNCWVEKMNHQRDLHNNCTSGNVQFFTQCSHATTFVSEKPNIFSVVQSGPGVKVTQIKFDFSGPYPLTLN